MRIDNSGICCFGILMLLLLLWFGVVLRVQQ
jgi:hypothetical protein